MHEIKALLIKEFGNLQQAKRGQLESVTEKINHTVSLKLQEHPEWVTQYKIMTYDKCRLEMKKAGVKSTEALIDDLVQKAKQGDFYPWVSFRTIERLFKKGDYMPRKREVFFAFLDIPSADWNMRSASIAAARPKANNSLEGKYYFYYTKPNDKGKLQRIVLSVGCEKNGIYPCQLHSNSDDVVEAKFRGKYLYIDVFYTDLGQTATQVYFLGKEKSPALAIGSGFDFTSSGFPFQSQSLLLKQASEEINQDKNCTFSLIDTESLQNCSEAEMVVINYFRHLKSEQGKWDTMTPPDVFSVEALREYLNRNKISPYNFDAFIGEYYLYYPFTEGTPFINRCIFSFRKINNEYSVTYTTPHGNTYISDDIELRDGLIYISLVQTRYEERDVLVIKHLYKPITEISFGVSASISRKSYPIGIRKVLIRQSESVELSLKKIPTDCDTSDKETRAVLNYFQEHKHCNLLLVKDEEFHKADFIKKWG